MGIREKLNEKPAITTGATIGIIVLALIVIIWQSFDHGPDLPTEAWYTTDDSSPEGALATLFADDINKIPPFDKDGKPAYRAVVFTCNDGDVRFVAYLERYTEESKQRLEQMMETDPPGAMDPMAYDELMVSGVEVKKPGSGPWVSQANYEAYRKIAEELACPDGSKEGLVPDMPD